MIVTDLDGTLLRTDKKISARKKNALRFAREENCVRITRAAITTGKLKNRSEYAINKNEWRKI